jgi:hypothetical protein
MNDIDFDFFDEFLGMRDAQKCTKAATIVTPARGLN